MGKRVLGRILYGIFMIVGIGLFCVILIGLAGWLFTYLSREDFGFTVDLVNPLSGGMFDIVVGSAGLIAIIAKYRNLLLFLGGIYILGSFLYRLFHIYGLQGSIFNIDGVRSLKKFVKCCWCINTLWLIFIIGFLILHHELHEFSDYAGDSFATYPDYDGKLGGGKVTVLPDGTRINNIDGEEYNYLS